MTDTKIKDTHVSKDKPPESSIRQWAIPYVDQPLVFWMRIADQFAARIKEVYFPLPGSVIGSGEPTQPSMHLDSLLRDGPFGCSVLLNPITLPRPVEAIVPNVIEALRRLIGEYGLAGATVTNLTLATRIREALPDLTLTASCLMEISQPNQALMLNGICDNLVPSSRIVRDLSALRGLKAAFAGNIRLLVNEGCLPGCPFRVQHFHEMGCDLPFPRSLCTELLEKHPWMRLTSGWILPQHLHLYDGTYDELKIGGRVTLRFPDRYLEVLDAYVHRKPLPPNKLGGGPASVLTDIEIREEFFANTLDCHHNCHECSFCYDYYSFASKRLGPAKKGKDSAAI
jgi:hypothetical protein